EDLGHGGAPRERGERDAELAPRSRTHADVPRADDARDEAAAQAEADDGAAPVRERQPEARAAAARERRGVRRRRQTRVEEPWAEARDEIVANERAPRSVSQRRVSGRHRHHAFTTTRSRARSQRFA